MRELVSVILAFLDAEGSTDGERDRLGVEEEVEAIDLGSGLAVDEDRTAARSILGEDASGALRFR